MFLLATIAFLVSAIPIIMLCIGDPKRRRAVGGKGDGMAPGKRRLLAAAACLPGLACALLGDPAALMMWLGGCALLGWALAAWFRANGTTPAA
jgi:hypothetical protein